MSCVLKWLLFTRLMISELALQMGLACGLDSKEFPISGVVEPERSHWLRVWESLRFLTLSGFHDR